MTRVRIQIRFYWRNFILKDFIRQGNWSYSIIYKNFLCIWWNNTKKKSPITQWAFFFVRSNQLFGLFLLKRKTRNICYKLFSETSEILLNVINWWIWSTNLIHLMISANLSFKEKLLIFQLGSINKFNFKFVL